MPPIARAAYDELAEAYAALVDDKPHNAHYDRPATLSLLPEVAGRRVLDAGCGPGVYAEWLVERGASVLGLDAAPRMLEIFRRRLGERAEARLHDLDSPLDFLPDGSFDIVLSALALDYVRDWRAVFREFHRVLRPGGVVVFSLEHPASRWRMDIDETYHQVERQDVLWASFAVKVVMPSYRRPLGEVLNPLLEAGFRLDRVLEPLPTEEFRRRDPRGYEELCREPGFLCLRALRSP
jgi:SAM-dependent methyltransferase